LLDYCSLEDPHIGYGVKNALLMGKKISATKIEGEYFDCGTPTEYLEMLRRILT
jgi:UTP-glucose-1-phosphate uridylyltransferase